MSADIRIQTNQAVAFAVSADVVVGLEQLHKSWWVGLDIYILANVPVLSTKLSYKHRDLSEQTERGLGVL